MSILSDNEFLDAVLIIFSRQDLDLWLKSVRTIRFLADAYRMVLDIVDIYLRMIKENKGEIL